MVDGAGYIYWQGVYLDAMDTIDSMTKHELKLFDEKQIRTVWDEVQEKWYFCINDVIAALTDCKDPVDYFKKVRRRDPELDVFVRGTNCPPPPIYLH